MWQQNLFSNLLTIAILLTIFIMIYCRVKGVTFIEIFKDVKGAMADE